MTKPSQPAQSYLLFKYILLQMYMKPVGCVNLLEVFSLDKFITTQLKYLEDIL